MSYLRYLCLFVHSGVHLIVLCFCFVFLRLVYPMFPVSLNCPFLIAPSVFSNVYLLDFKMLIVLSTMNNRHHLYSFIFVVVISPTVLFTLINTSSAVP